MTKQKIDVGGILNTLASIRQLIPHLAAPPTYEMAGAATFLIDSDGAMETFEMETLAGALESFTSELSDSIRTSEQSRWRKHSRSITPPRNWPELPHTHM